MINRKPNCNCKVCNKSIYRRPKQIEGGNVFCSIECYSKWNTIFVKCSICGEMFKSGLNKKTCSKGCANKLRIGSTYRQSPGRPIKDKVKSRRILKERLVSLRGSFCEHCSYPNVDILTVHHKIRRCDGGNDDMDNLELLCPNCHAEIHYGR